MLGVDERVVDSHASAWSDNTLVSEALDLSMIHVHRGGIDSFKTDITSDDLNVKIRLDLSKVFHFSTELFVLLFIVDWPVLERITIF